MAPINATDVVRLIRSPAPRVRIGLWLVPPEQLGQVPAEAVRLGLDSVDLRARWLSQLPEGTRFAGLGPERMLEVLDNVISQTGAHDAVLAYNVDLLLARLDYPNRRRVWQQLQSYLPHRARGLLIVMPATADELLPPPDEQAAWERDGRLAR